MDNDSSLVDEYIIEGQNIEKLFNLYLSHCEDSSQYGCLKLSKEAEDKKREILRRYEVWYEIVLSLVHKYSRKTEEFISHYSGIKKVINNDIYRVDGAGRKVSHLEFFIDTFDEQKNILYTLKPIIELEAKNYKKIISADLLNSEIDQADLLYDYDFYRAAGAIAGVVLERYLKTKCDLVKIEYSEKDTIVPLVTVLYKNNIEGFDKTLLKSIEHLSDIRNKCTHPKDEPKPQEVRELIDKVKKLIFIL